MPTPQFAAWGGAVLLLIYTSPLAAGPINPPEGRPVEVVATLPILKEFVQEVGHEHVHVTTLITGFENEHSYAPKPSHLRAISNARLLVEVGLGLEVWVRGLIKSAGNDRIRVVTTSRDVSAIMDADTRPQTAGNPHIWLDPENAKIMTRHIADGLIEVDPIHKAAYQDNRDRYLRQLDDLQRELAARVARLADRRFIAYHPAWPYFAKRFGFQIEGDIVRQTGAEPTAAHLARLAQRMKREHIKVIVSEPQLNQKMAQALARDTGAKIVMLSTLPGAIKGTDTYPALLTYNVRTLVDALGS